MTKHLCLVVRYLYPGSGTIDTQFLDLVPMLYATSDDLFVAVTATLSQFDIGLKYLYWGGVRWYLSDGWYKEQPVDQNLGM